MNQIGALLEAIKRSHDEKISTTMQVHEHYGTDLTAARTVSSSIGV